MSQRELINKGVANGRWGEAVAVEFLRRHGFEILETNSRPFKKDQRLEIDIVARDKKEETIVFVEVKQHSNLSPYQRRLRRVDSKKKKNLRCVCNAWRRCNNLCSSPYRFDVVEIYGEPGYRPIIDHISNVRLFVPGERFVRWG